MSSRGPVTLTACLIAVTGAFLATASEETPKASGGTTFQVAVAYDKVYDTALNLLKRQDKTIESASKETGQIVTVMDIGAGGFIQKGTQIRITVMKDSDSQTTVRAAVQVQQRVSGTKVHPWRDAKVDEQESNKLADAIKAALAPPQEPKK